MTLPTHLFAEAFGHHQAGRSADAERLYLQVIAADPRHADSHHLLGVLALQAGQFALAADRIAQAIALNGANPAFHSNLSYACTRAGRAAEAVAAARQAIVLNPLYPEAFNNLGIALEDLTHKDEAAAAYRRAGQGARIGSTLEVQPGGGSGGGPSLGLVLKRAEGRMRAEEVLGAMRARLFGQGDLVRVCDQVCGQELTPREAGGGEREGLRVEAVLKVALDLLGRG